MDENSQEYKIPPESLAALFCDTITAAQILGRSRASVYDMVNRGVLTAYRIGTQTLYSRDDVGRLGAALRLLETRR